MKKEKENKVLKGIMDVDNSTAVLLYNFYNEMKMVKKDMVNSLDLLDEVVEGDKNKKEQLRKKILDNYNETPRKTLRMIEDLTKTLEKE